MSNILSISEISVNSTCLIRILVYHGKNTVLRFYPLFNIFIVTMMTVQYSTHLLDVSSKVVKTEI
jgi:hypothetical protein